MVVILDKFFAALLYNGNSVLLHFIHEKDETIKDGVRRGQLGNDPMRIAAIYRFSCTFLLSIN